MSGLFERDQSSGGYVTVYATDRVGRAVNIHTDDSLLQA